jgi:integrase
MRFTDQSVRALPHSEHGQKEYSDDAIPGLAVVVGKRSKTFTLVTGRGQSRKRHTLGRYDPPRFTLAMAREKARDVIARERLAKTEVPRTTFEEAVELYDRLHLRRLRPTTARDMRRTLNRNFSKLRKVPLADITRRDVAPVLDDMLATPAAMGAAFRHLRAFLRWCIGRGYLEASPIERLPAPKRADSRSRVLSREELVAIWRAAPDTDYGRIIKLCILSAQRRGQWAACRREYMQDDIITWPTSVMKAGKAHAIPLTPAIRALLSDRIGHLFPTAGGIPFNNWAACKERLDQTAGVTAWRHHDLRRTWATVAADELNIDPHIIESVLAHAIGTPIARIYNRARYLEPMRKALLAFEEWLDMQPLKPEDTNERHVPRLHHERSRPATS